LITGGGHFKITMKFTKISWNLRKKALETDKVMDFLALGGVQTPSKLYISFCRHALDSLEKQLHNINDDLALKNNSLMLDNRCMDVRGKLKASPLSTTDKNLSVTGIERERSKVLA
jgi:hypothetical protein